MPKKSVPAARKEKPNERLENRGRGWGVFVSLFVLLSGCALFQSGITYYDPTTYKNLTDLKPEVVMLYESFAAEVVDTMWVRAVRLKLRQVHEYEKGKGEANIPTANQIGTIIAAFEDDVVARLASAAWNIENIENSVENISEAFDTAISTEHLKNKNK